MPTISKVKLPCRIIENVAKCQKCETYSVMSKTDQFSTVSTENCLKYGKDSRFYFYFIIHQRFNKICICSSSSQRRTIFSQEIESNSLFNYFVEHVALATNTSNYSISQKTITILHQELVQIKYKMYGAYIVDNAQDITSFIQRQK